MNKNRQVNMLIVNSSPKKMQPMFLAGWDQKGIREKNSINS